MAEKATPRIRTRGLKTWSSFGNLGRRPTDYEVLTHNMNHTTGAVPLEMGPDVHGNQWLRTHRDGMRLKATDWDAFRDPDAVTYGSYVAAQDDQETYLENLIAQFDSEGYDDKLDATALSLLRHAMTPTRYVGHCQQMLSAYVQQLAVSSYVATAAAFQTADQLRRVQTVAYRTTQLKFAHPDLGFATGEKAEWTTHPHWQPVREAFEWALVEFDWDRAFVAANLVTKFIGDRLFLVELGKQCQQVGATLDALVLENLWHDAERSRRWTAALVTFLSEQDPGNLAVLQEYLDAWGPRANAMIEAGAKIVGSAAIESRGADPTIVADAVRADWRDFLGGIGLRAPSA